MDFKLGLSTLGKPKGIEKVEKCIKICGIVYPKGDELILDKSIAIMLALIPIAFQC